MNTITETIFELISPDGDFYNITVEGQESYLMNLKGHKGEHYIYFNTKEMMYLTVNTLMRDGWMIEDHRY